MRTECLITKQCLIVFGRQTFPVWTGLHSSKAAIIPGVKRSRHYDNKASSSTTGPKKSLEISPFLILYFKEISFCQAPGQWKRSKKRAKKRASEGKRKNSTPGLNYFSLPALSIVCTNRDPGIGYLTIIRRRLSEYCRIIPKTNRRRIIEHEENNCFSIIAQVIIRATAFSFILLLSSL